ncbi:DUF2919 domain-containing protein [Shewanella avicenniae]|uniref:DUF2919 domain-containing protein n=1 Tax=Shewanella avicenniae TaxID=2814294 RepID=A0ABX7QWQ5_9GAMM|nr:DUF2919 domain-containing protein [Shewanella avicenniae]QSX35091.1 DUF2919 domain-containing protein [Shewanella avicenniae]
MFSVEDVRWLDDKGHIRPPLVLYLLLLFIARGWVIFILSLTDGSDRAALVRFFFPERSDFLISLAAGAGAVLLFLLVTAERRRKPQWLSHGFQWLRPMLLVLLIVDAGLLFYRLKHNHFWFEWSMALDALFLFWSLLYLRVSRHLKLYCQDWRG